MLDVVVHATGARPPIEQIEVEIAAIAPNPWRAVFDEGELVIWFHALLTREPRRIIVGSGPSPSPNELAAATFLVHCREYIRALIAYAQELDTQREQARALAAELSRHVPPALTLFDGGVPPRPRIVCLCGSTRFWRTFQQASLAETMAGRIVLSIGAASGTDDEHFGNLPRADYDAVKQQLDTLHLRKIDLCDEVLILNVEGYVGESTARELAYARSQGKPVRWWEVPAVEGLPT